MRAPDVSDVAEPRPQAPAWLVDLTIVLGLVVVVLGAWLVNELRSESEASSGRAEISVRDATSLIDQELGAIKAFLPAMYGPLHTTDAVFIDRTTGARLSGPRELEVALASDAVAFSHSPVRTTPVEVVDDMAVYGVSWGLNTASKRRGAGIVIVSFEGGKIAREVLIPMGGVRATDDMLP